MAVARTKQDDGDDDYDDDDEWRILLPFYVLRLSLANFNSCFALLSLFPSPPSLFLLLSLTVSLFALYASARRRILHIFYENYHRQRCAAQRVTCEARRRGAAT